MSDKQEDFFEEWIKDFLEIKAQDALRCQENKSAGLKLPVLGKAETFNERLSLVKDANTWEKKTFHYVADPWYRDWYTKPEVAFKLANRLQGKSKDEFEKAFKESGLGYDCDDTGNMAFRLLEVSGWPEDKGLYLITLVMPFHMHVNPLNPYWWDHVMCLAEVGNGWWCTIDTNGLRWFKEANGNIDDQVKAYFGKLYATQYDYLIREKSPFKG